MTPDEFRSHRTTAGLTQAQAAQLLYVTVSTVSHWEMGLHAIAPLAAEKIQQLAKKAAAKGAKS